MAIVTTWGQSLAAVTGRLSQPSPHHFTIYTLQSCLGTSDTLLKDSRSTTAEARQRQHTSGALILRPQEASKEQGLNGQDRAIMSAPLPKRIIKETERLQNEPVPGISAEPHDENARYFDVWVDGPDGSCYEGEHA